MENKPKNNKENLSKRILETKQQTEELKAQLQNLIDAGISTFNVTKTSNLSNVNEINTHSDNKVQIIKSFDKEHSKHVNKLEVKETKSSQHKETINKNSPNKVKNYNVEEAREYIKKQREKRLEMLTSKKKENITTAELQKKKLEELHKKSQELVSKNLQAKRERFKALEKGQYIRPDINNPPRRDIAISEKRSQVINPQRTRSISRETAPKSSSIRERSVSRERVTQTVVDRSRPTQRLNVREISTERATGSDKNIKTKNTKSPNLLYPPEQKYGVATVKTRSEESVDIKTTTKTPLQKTEEYNAIGDFNNLITQKEISWEDSSNNKKTHFSLPKSPQEIEIISGNGNSNLKELVNTRYQQNGEESHKNKKIVVLSNVTLQPRARENMTKLDDVNGKTLTNVYDDYQSDAPEQEKTLKVITAEVMNNSSRNKDTKQTQTTQEQKLDFPMWLQEKQAKSDPYNFINSVKRKLQYALASPAESFTNAASQNVQTNANLDMSRRTQQIKESIQKSITSSKHTDLKSFMSHKCLNLNPEAVEHFELIQKQNAPPNDQTRKSQTVTKISSESESDTSKNIPDISSESGTSLRRNFEHIKQLSLSKGDNLKISTEKLDNMRLKPCGVTPAISINSEIDKYSSDSETVRNPNKHLKLNKSTNDTNANDCDKKKISRNLFADQNFLYSPDFQTDSDSGRLNKSRESIVSYNCSKYNSPNTNKSAQKDISTEKHSKNSLTEPTSVKTADSFEKNRNILDNVSGDKHSKNNLTEYSSSLKTADSPKKSCTSDKSKTLNSNVPISVTLNSTSIPTLSDIKSVGHSKQSDQYTSLHSGAHPTLFIESDQDIFKSNSTFSQPTAAEKALQSTSTGNILKSKSENVLSTLQTETRIHNNSGTKSDTDYSRISSKHANNMPKSLSLREPSVSLKISNKRNLEKDSSNKKADKSALMKNICVRSGEHSTDLTNTNEIHLKFEAEIHLLNDFNESLRNFSEIEKAFDTLRSKNDPNITTRTRQNRDTQTSIITKTSTATRTSENNPVDESRSQISTINYTRGSEINDDISSSILLGNSLSRLPDESGALVPSSLLLSDVNYDESTLKKTKIVKSDLSNFENLHSKNMAGMSIRMFDQLVQDEDNRLENLKMILKIREKALLDRTKAELAWLEIQKKHLKETGRVQEASLVKKKQRGILLKHQQERHEMQRLKQMQKAASNERKIILKEQRNLIKNQLCTENMLSKMKVNTPRERRLSGPLKVFQTQSDSVRSETSISTKKSTTDEEVHSVTSHSYSIVSRVSEVSIEAGNEVEPLDLMRKFDSQAVGAPISQMKRTLLMREATLQKRRKAAEDLLQWHKKLLEEEKRITELECTANTIISQIPNETTLKTNTATTSNATTEKYKFKGKQLNQLWLNLTGCDDKKFVEDKVYPMSQIALERFCRSAREYSLKTKKLLTKVDSDVNTDSYISDIGATSSIPEKLIASSDKTNFDLSILSQSAKQSASENIPIGTSNYTSDFDVESVQEISNEQGMDDVDQSKISSISQLIDNFSKIKDVISSLSIIQSTKVSAEDNPLDTELDDSIASLKTDQSVKELSPEISVIDAAETSKKERLKFQNEVKGCTVSEKPSIDTEKSSKPSTVEEIKDISEEKTSTDKEITPQEISGKENLPPTDDIIKEYVIETKSSADVKTIEAALSTEGSKEAEASEHSIISDIIQVAEIESKKDTDIEEELSRDKEEATDKSKENETKVQSHSETESSEKSLEEIDSLQNVLESKAFKTTSIQEFELKTSEDVSTEFSDKDSVISSNQVIDKQTDSDNRSAIYSELSENKKPVTRSEEYSSIVNESPKECRTELEDKETSEEKSDVSLEELKSVSSDIQSSEPENTDALNEKSASNVEEIKSVAAKEAISTETHSENIDTVNEKSITPPEDLKSIANEEIKTSETQSEDKYTLNEKSIASIEDLKSSASKEVNSCEEKEQDSFSSTSSHSAATAEKNSSEKKPLGMKTEESKEVSPQKEESLSEPITTISQSSVTTESSRSLPKSSARTEKSKDGSTILSSGSKSVKSPVNVKKRVSEILADASHGSRGDKSPRLQDLYVTTYDLVSPTSSPDSGSPIEEKKSIAAKSLFGSEAEELLRKQLAIEQEIKQITEQQQKEKEQLPYMYVREIPNKPPPPYTPPSQTQDNVITILPKNKEEVCEITKYSAKIIHKAYLSNNLQNITISDNTLNLIAENIDKECFKFVFDLCREVAKDHYKQFEKEEAPSWLQVKKSSQLAVVKPLDAIGLEKFMNKKLLEIFGFQKPDIRENTIIKWSRKKRDFVDEILVLESQAEEAQWTDFEKDELLVVNEVTNDIMNMLLKETGDVFNEIFSKKKYLY